ncbi:MAG: sugar ABC transporter substrate-binding protein, partial [Gemmataceae bacterium]|nr:sugar ABC transporter substrate-binding protein [Gemmataceae bacterium]
SARIMEDILQGVPDLSAVFCINDPSALGCRAALEKAVKTSILIIGFDGQKEGKQAIKEGKIYADPIQFPEKIAQITVESIQKFRNGEKLPKEILIPTGLYRKADAAKDSELN